MPFGVWGWVILIVACMILGALISKYLCMGGGGATGDFGFPFNVLWKWINVFPKVMGTGCFV